MDDIIELGEVARSSFTAILRLIEHANLSGEKVAGIVMGERIVVSPGDCPHQTYDRCCNA